MINIVNDASVFICNENLLKKTIFNQHELERENRGHALPTNCAHDPKTENTGILTRAHMSSS